MKIKFFLLITLFLFSNNLQAGWKINTIGGAILYRTAPILIKKGSPFAIKQAKKIISSYIKKNPQHLEAVKIFFIGLAIENYIITDKTLDILEDLNLIDSQKKRKTKEDSEEFKKARVIVSNSIKDINVKKECKGGVHYSALINNNLTNFMSDNNKPVQLFDVGSFSMLLKNAKTGDRMEHDHIPSNKAVKTFLENNLKIKIIPDSIEEKAYYKNSTTLEVSEEMHADGRTYRGRNTKAKYELDGLNLKEATIKDLSYHLVSSNFNLKLLIPFKKLYLRNAKMCLYK
jgi:hypothetical protein